MRNLLMAIGLLVGALAGCAAGEATPYCDTTITGDYWETCPDPEALRPVCGDDAREEVRADGSTVVVGQCGQPWCSSDGTIACVGLADGTSCPEGTRPRCVERAQPGE